MQTVTGQYINVWKWSINQHGGNEFTWSIAGISHGRPSSPAWRIGDLCVMSLPLHQSTHKIIYHGVRVHERSYALQYVEIRHADNQCRFYDFRKSPSFACSACDSSTMNPPRRRDRWPSYGECPMNVSRMICLVVTMGYEDLRKLCHWLHQTQDSRYNMTVNVTLTRDVHTCKGQFSECPTSEGCNCRPEFR